MTAPQTPVIRSLLDTDLYKFTMLQVILHQFPQTHSLYEFRCRNKDMVYPLADIQSDLERELDALCQLRFTHDELDYLRSLRFIKSDFVDYLELFQLQRRFVKTGAVSEKGRVERVAAAVLREMVAEQAQTAARFMQEDVAGGNVPLAGSRGEFGIEVGIAFRNSAEFEGAAAADVAVVAEIVAEVRAHPLAQSRTGGDDGRWRRCGAALQAASVAARVGLVGALSMQRVPVVAADWGVDEAERWPPLPDAGNGDAELARVFDKFARAVNGVNQPVVVRRILVDGSIGFFAQAGEVNDARQFADKDVVRGEVGRGERGVVAFLLNAVAVRPLVERQNRCPGFLSESSDLFDKVLRVSAQKVPVRHFFWYRVFR